jgi:DNA-binding MarR family transcriptional regulator
VASIQTDDAWRLTHLGRLLGHAMRRFDQRVLQLMANNVDVPLALSNLAARAQVSAAHVHITRHLALEGSRLTDLAHSAGMSKQAMGDLVDQCEAWGLVSREPDPLDARARRVRFTATGLAWLQAFREAVRQAEAEFRAEVGEQVATVVAIGLEAYASATDQAGRTTRAP